MSSKGWTIRPGTHIWQLEDRSASRICAAQFCSEMKPLQPRDRDCLGPGSLLPGGYCWRGDVWRAPSKAAAEALLCLGKTQEERLIAFPPKISLLAASEDQEEVQFCAGLGRRDRGEEGEMKRGSIASGGGIPGPESLGNFPEGWQRGLGRSRGPALPPAASARAGGLQRGRRPGGCCGPGATAPRPGLPGRQRRLWAAVGGQGQQQRPPRSPAGTLPEQPGGVNPRPHLVAARVHCTEPCWRGRECTGAARSRVGVHTHTGVARSLLPVHTRTGTARSRVSVHTRTGVARGHVNAHTCMAVARSRVSVHTCTGVAQGCVSTYTYLHGCCTCMAWCGASVRAGTGTGRPVLARGFVWVQGRN